MIHGKKEIEGSCNVVVVVVVVYSPHLSVVLFKTFVGKKRALNNSDFVAFYTLLPVCVNTNCVLKPA